MDAGASNRIFQQPELPPRNLPLFYLGFSAISLILAMAGLVRFAQDFTGFYYHPHILALTHLVTLGWITGNILGFLYIAGPMTLQITIPVRWTDVLIFCLYWIGVSGMVSHFWISHDLGTAYSAACVYVAVVWTAIQWLSRLPRSKVPGFVKLHLFLAFTNVLVAFGWGMLIAINKAHPFLPTLPAPNILAHAHMAATGWALMLVFGMAYRFLPMFIPGEPSRGVAPWISAILLECGVVGLFVSLLLQRPWSLFFGCVIAAGVAIFLQQSIRSDPPETRSSAETAASRFCDPPCRGIVLLAHPGADFGFGDYTTCANGRFASARFDSY